MFKDNFYNALTEKLLRGESLSHSEASELISIGKSIDASQSLAMFDSQGCLLDANEQFLKLYNYELEDLVGQHHHVMVTPEMANDPSYAQYWETLHAGHSICGEFERVTRDGKRIHIFGIASPVLDAEGKAERFIKFAHDVTSTRLKSIDTEARMRAIDNTQAVLEIDAEGLIQQANQNLLRILQCTREDLLQRPYTDLLPKGQLDSERYRQFLSDLSAGLSRSGVFEQVDPRGQSHWVQGTYTPIMGLDGKLTRVVMFATDVTESKLMALENEGKMAAIDRTQAVIEFDLQGRILYANPLFLDAMGYTADELIGMHHSRLCDKEYADGADYKLFWDELRAGEPKSGEFKRYDKRGQLVWLQATYTPILGLDGKPTKIVKFATDVTQPKMKALEDDGKVSAISRSNAMVEFDMAGNVLTANDNFLTLMGYSLEEIVGQHHRMFVDNDSFNPAAYRAFWHRLGQGHFEAGEYLRVGKNVKRVWLRASYNPIFDLEGQPVKIIKFCTDVTAEKLAALENEARLDTIAKTTCVMDLDALGQICSANSAMLQALSLPRDELIGRNQASLFFAEDQAGNQERWVALRRGETVTGEYRHRGQLDKEVWLSMSATPVMGLDNSLSKVIVLAQDITVNKLAQLDASAKLGAMDRSQAIIEFELTGRILTANQNFLALTGYALDEIAGRHHRMFVEAAVATSSEYQNFWERLGRGESFSGEFKRIGKDGREVWIQATYNPVIDALGRALKVVKFASDVTQQKVRNSEFEAKVAAIDKGQAVIEFDLEGNVITANRNFLAAMGYTLREIQGQHHSMFCTPEYTQSIEYRDFWLRLSEGQFIRGRFNRVGKYQRSVWLQSTYNPILDLNGRVVKVIKYAFDVTKEVQLEQSIASRADEMNRSVNALVDSIRHIVENSAKASVRANETLQAAEVGYGAINKSITAIGRIESGSSKVAEIVQVISDIASQTNLLAFNAAIEAARAGQHGVGFSVVAAEVRKLAERSANAAKEITDLIADSARQVGEGSKVSVEAANSFEGILSNVKSTVSNVDRIAQEAKEQGALANEVASLIKELTLVSGHA